PNARRPAALASRCTCQPFRQPPTHRRRSHSMEAFSSPFIVPVGIMFAVAFMTVGTQFAKALGRKWDRQNTAQLPHDVGARLERMEHAIESVAVEVERISEGQRFTTRLLTGRAAEPDRVPRSGEPGR